MQNYTLWSTFFRKAIGNHLHIIHTPHHSAINIQLSSPPAPPQQDFLPVFHRSSRAGNVHSKVGFPIFSFTKLCCWHAHRDSARRDPTLRVETSRGR